MFGEPEAPENAAPPYIFRPFHLTKVKYKHYKSLFNRGINNYPRPRSGHRIVCNDSDIFCFGGFLPNNRQLGADQLFREFWRFNTFTQKWTLLVGPCDGVETDSGSDADSDVDGDAIGIGSNEENDDNDVNVNDPLPYECASNSMYMHNDTVIIYGGTGFPFGTTLSNRVHVIYPYHRPRPTVRKLVTSGTAPPPLYGQSILVHDGFLYAVGGTTGYDYSCDIHRLDLKTLEWQAVSICRPENGDDPAGRYRHEIVTDGDFMYVIGGGTAMRTLGLDSVPSFNLHTRVWTKLQTLPDLDAPTPGVPLARKCHSCVSQRNSNGQIEVIIAGGIHDERCNLNDIWLLNLHTLRWRLLSTAVLPNPLHFHDAASSGNGLMYLFGGIRSDTDPMSNIQPARTNDVYRVWVKVPTLGEMCWDALRTIRPQLALIDSNGLLRIGIPQQYVRRLKGVLRPSTCESDNGSSFGEQIVINDGTQRLEG